MSLYTRDGSDAFEIHVVYRKRGKAYDACATAAGFIEAEDICSVLDDVMDWIDASNVLCVYSQGRESGRVVEHFEHNGWAWDISLIRRLRGENVKNAVGEHTRVPDDWVEKRRARQRAKKEESDA